MIVLLSGGLDSAVVLAMTPRGSLCIGFDYGQPHKIELERAAMIAEHYKARLEIVRLPNLPKVNDVVFGGRNMVFASVAIAMAQARGHGSIWIGCNASDWAEFPDCRPLFWQSMGAAAEAYGVSLVTPLIQMSKTEVAATARQLNVPIELTWSCYSPQNGQPCRKCLACETREKALQCS